MIATRIIVSVIGLLVILSFPLIYHIIDKKRKEKPCKED